MVKVGLVTPETKENIMLNTIDLVPCCRTICLYNTREVTAGIGLYCTSRPDGITPNGECDRFTVIAGAEHEWKELVKVFSM